MPRGVKRDRGAYGTDALEVRGAIWPVRQGRGSLGNASVLAAYPHVEPLTHPGVPQGAVPIAGCGGHRLARQKDSGGNAAAAVSRALTISADAARPCVNISCTSTSQAAQAFLDGLRLPDVRIPHLRSARPALTDAHLAVALGLLWFEGELPASQAQPLLPVRAQGRGR